MRSGDVVHSDVVCLFVCIIIVLSSHNNTVCPLFVYCISPSSMHMSSWSCWRLSSSLRVLKGISLASTARLARVRNRSFRTHCCWSSPEGRGGGGGGGGRGGEGGEGRGGEGRGEEGGWGVTSTPYILYLDIIHVHATSA